MKKQSQKCLLCGNNSISLKKDDDYLNGFCETCIMSMEKEKESKSQIIPPYDNIIQQITDQIENIRISVTSILDKSGHESSFSSVSSKGSSSPSRSQPKKDHITTTILKPDSPTNKKTAVKNSKEPPIESMTQPKKQNKKSKYTPTITPIPS